MKIYHGTTAKVAKQSLKHGLHPRIIHGNSNWKHSDTESNPYMVYLTTAYAPYFALNAIGDKDTHFGIVEIDLDKLDKFALYPFYQSLGLVPRIILSKQLASILSSYRQPFPCHST
jgi:hypothetical protein